ncbi:MAG: hypothetical protein CL844_02375 [Crocinitomicaceae bacterium]|nr:hypothetical protein [Crocinitomicaceae bacterium]|tara:strand:+ start:104043 stop:104924 length:882 start_codon:yes stop_codon:yes gene_type:complete
MIDKFFILTLTLTFFLFNNSCDTNVDHDSNIEKELKSIIKDSISDIYDIEHNNIKYVDSIFLDNGIEIKWIENGVGQKLKYADCAMIDYKVLLEDNTIVDGNYLIKKRNVPFLLGFNMQTIGWEISLKQLKVGDSVEIFIPSKLARGEKGIENLIPPNSNNIIQMRVHENRAPTREIDGNKIWVFEENNTNKLKFNFGYEIQFHCMVSTPSNPLYINTYRSNNPFSFNLNSKGVVPGLKKALINSKKSDRMFVYIPHNQGYRDKGYQNLVKSNEDLFYNIMVMDVINTDSKKD